MTAAGIPDRIRQIVTSCVIDTIGVAIAGARTPVAGTARHFAARNHPPGRAEIWGTKDRVSALAAAFCNATAAHALDFDDNCYAGFVHGSAVIVPAAFAARAGDRRDGRRADHGDHRRRGMRVRRRRRRRPGTLRQGMVDHRPPRPHRRRRCRRPSPEARRAADAVLHRARRHRCGWRQDLLRERRQGAAGWSGQRERRQMGDSGGQWRERCGRALHFAERLCRPPYRRAVRHFGLHRSRPFMASGDARHRHQEVSDLPVVPCGGGCRGRDHGAGRFFDRTMSRKSCATFLPSSRPI